MPGSSADAPTSVSLFDQGLVQVLPAAVTGLKPRQPYILGLALHADGSGRIEPLASFMTNPAGAAIVNAIGPIRQITQDDASGRQSWLVVTEGSAASLGQVVQVQGLPPASR